MRALHLQLRVDANLVKPFCHLCFASSLNVSPLIAFRPIKYPHLQKFNPSRSSRRTHFSTSFVASSMADSSLSRSSETETKPFSVLFVCLGNICRSPAAEGVFRNLVTKKDLDSKFTIDSAGTIGYHEGNEADPRMRAASKRRGIAITSISRPIQPSDFVNFDLILAMDKQNREDILGAFERWCTKNGLPPDSHKKVKLMCSYCKKHDETEVPDPYYGGQQGFEKVLDLLEDACESLLESILAENKHISD
ncbi:uncharacterized protein LOC101207515 [Cucumis sativus]|uniref:acid phosphatase n=1 Tax=Cucumis sativus TaxID=3659 RepID=A0A0A0KEU9_CUCSA|nr:uncharacterized protein LOC101207515 [Cucumis sativus]KGN46932.1 hypothetical protein Csa_021073 [Cucumis sativus]